MAKRGIVFLAVAFCVWLASCRMQVSLPETGKIGDAGMTSDEGLDSKNSDGQNVKGSWSVGGELTTGNVDRVVSMQAEFPPGDYTIQFDLEQPLGTSTNANVRAVALITWSVRGNQVTRRVNVGNGVSVSGNAEGVRVVMTDTTDLSFGGGLGLPYQVTATMTKGTRPSVQQPPILLPFPGASGGAVPLAPAATITIPIPIDSGAISILVTVSVDDIPPSPLPEQGVQVAQIGGGAALIMSSYDPRAFGWCPLQAGTTAVIITNTTAAQNIRVNVYFGIDG